jgi:seryl-tRNA(Sec) selenium transferase
MSVYDELGVRPFINARAPYTRFGGAIMHPDVVAAMAEAARAGGVHLAEIHEKVGKAIATLTRNEAAYVSCGCASGITLAVATCIVGMDEKLAERLPETSSMRNRVVMYAGERGTECDVAIRCAGGRIVDFGRSESAATESDLATMLDEAPAAAVVLLAGDRANRPSTARVTEIAHERGVPVIVDGADCVPPRENFWRWTCDAGADALVVSGGKKIGGPQSTGLVIGSRRIVDGCLFHGLPNCRLGRGMKVGKEEMVGIYAAVKRLMTSDEAAEHAAHVRQADEISRELTSIPGVAITRERDVWLHVAFPESAAGMSHRETYDWFLAHDPSILMGAAQRGGISFSTMMLEPGQERAIIRQFRNLLRVPVSS